MAERRPSGINSRRPSVIPYLAGIEKPVLPSIPSQCDVLICGTGLVESILAAALAWQGSRVLHVDANPYYGDTCATLTIEQIKAWCASVNDGSSGFQGFSKAMLHIPYPHRLNSRDYGIDLSPRVLFAKSDLLSLLINSRVYRYLEFQSLSNFHTFENDTFGKMLSTKEEIFTDQSMTLASKRQLMKMMKFVLEYDLPENKEELETHMHEPFTDYVSNRFHLSSQQINELCYALGLAPKPDISTIQGLSRVRRYLVSFNIYGNFPTLYSKYGGPGEISQGFCRSAAVAGATYKLDCALKSFDPDTKTATFEDGSKVKISEKVVCSPSQAPEGSRNVPERNYEITRLITIVEKSCKEWFAEGESAALVVFPPKSLPSNNQFPVQSIIMGSGTGCCPKDQCVWYLSTIEQGERGRRDLESALKKMEESILRESEDGGFDVELTESDVAVQANGGISVINSVKLGKSFKGFVPKEKLTYLLKLMFTQYTSVAPFGVVSNAVFEKAEENDHPGNGPDLKVIYSSMPSTEISYDGVVTEARLLYSKIVGSDDDFFDVDFEDDEDYEHGPSSESAIVDDAEEFQPEMAFEL
ncbi:DEKNAAC100882 [Brettanomyces naardenensis]|uniref:Rab proteins geranylgeranyltransferase n=1 Tax=Brettanomyces naardenensis TaxID=13370 RepID=A0A448YEN5_BRENA|nr:DEKNAAC100882 [Brettanomyces naardenensis]